MHRNHSFQHQEQEQEQEILLSIKMEKWLPIVHNHQSSDNILYYAEKRVIWPDM